MCYGREAVFRISLALVLFYSICLVVSFKAESGGQRDYFDKHFFGLKYLGLLALVFVCFTFPGEAVRDYGEAARVGAVVFLLFQSVQMLELFYKWNEWWVTKAEEQEGCGYLMVGVTCLLYSLSIIAVSLALHYFSDCDFNVVVGVVTLAIGILITLLSVTKYRNESAGLLSATFCFAYCVFLLWSAVGSEPETCVQDVYRKQNSDWTSIISLIIMVGVVSVCCLNSAHDQDAFYVGDKGGGVFSPSLAHFVFVLSSCYITMLFTGWDIDKHQGKGTFDLGWTSVWVKISVQWFTALLYIWTLFAPLILENRGF